MMEYTLARIVTIVCGVALIASILPPVQSMFDSSESSEMQEQSQNICRMIDAFYDSEADEMVIPLNSLIPTNSYVTLDGYFVTIYGDDAEHRYDTRCQLISDSDHYNSNDILRFTRDDGKVMIENL